MKRFLTGKNKQKSPFITGGGDSKGSEVIDLTFDDDEDINPSAMKSHLNAVEASIEPENVANQPSIKQLKPFGTLVKPEIETALNESLPNTPITVPPPLPNTPP
ncbi:hypothetical protein EON64_13210, partial [archaeon]